MIQDRPISEDLNDKERTDLYKTIIGGVSWPAKHKGYAVVLGCARERIHSPWCAYVIDEFETDDIHELVHQCCVLDQTWKPDRWMGDADNDAAFEIMIAANLKYAEQDFRWLGLKLCPPLVLEYKKPYEYMSVQIRHLMDPDHCRLFLKDAKVRNYMALMLPGDLPILKFGDFPHVEAIAWAALDIYKVNESKLDRPRRGGLNRSPMRC